MIFNSKLSIFFALSLLLALGHCAIIPNLFCLRDFYRREPVSKGKCQAGKSLYGFMCYPPCPAHMPMTQFDCINPYCPDGLTSTPATCTQIYYRQYSWPLGLTFQQHAKAQRNCEAAFGYGNCILWFSSWVPKCIDGYENWYGNGCKKVNLDCAAYGFKHYPFPGSFCLKEKLFIVSASLVCPAGTDSYGLSCYSPCKEGYRGVGPYCWKHFSKGQLNCGVGLADQQACTAAASKINNLTLLFNLAAESIFIYEEILLIKDNQTSVEKTKQFTKAVEANYRMFYSQLISAQPHNELLPFLTAKQKLPQFVDSMRAISYIFSAQELIPILQLANLMVQFVSLFTLQEVNKMLRSTPFTTCNH